jgi:histidinol-phosphatase
MKNSPYLDVALEATKIAEKIIRQYYQSDLVVEIKADKSPVTIADQTAEAEIKKFISTRFKDHNFLGEEGGGGKKESQYTWIIDPVDGTKNFTRGLPFFCTQLGLMKDDEFVLGVANWPILGSQMYAERGAGAYLNNEPITVSKVDKLDESYFCHGGVKYFKEQGLLDQVAQLSTKTRFSRGWGAEFGQYYLPTGHLDVNVDAYIEVWDIAAFIVILEEAGGKITDFEGNKVSKETTRIISTNRLLHDQVVDYFRSHG